MTHRRTTARRHLLAALAGAALVAGGCASPFGDDGPEISVSLSTFPTAAVPLALDVVTNGGEVRVTDGRGASAPSSVQFRGDRYGDLPVSATLRATSGDILASVAFTQRYERDYSHSVSGVVSADRPSTICTNRVAAAPIAGRTDSLFVFYGSLPRGAVC